MTETGPCWKFRWRGTRSDGAVHGTGVRRHRLTIHFPVCPGVNSGRSVSASTPVGLVPSCSGLPASWPTLGSSGVRSAVAADCTLMTGYESRPFPPAGRRRCCLCRSRGCGDGGGGGGREEARNRRAPAGGEGRLTAPSPSPGPRSTGYWRFVRLPPPPAAAVTAAAAGEQDLAGHGAAPHQAQGETGSDKECEIGISALHRSSGAGEVVKQRGKTSKTAVGDAVQTGCCISGHARSPACSSLLTDRER